MANQKTQIIDFYARVRSKLRAEGKLIQPKDPYFDSSTLAPKLKTPTSRSFVSTATGKKFFDTTSECDDLIEQGVIREVF